MYISLVSSGAERENMKPKQSNFNWKFTRIVVGKVLAWGTLFVGINENSIVWKQISKSIKVLHYFVLLELQWIKTSNIFFLSNRDGGFSSNFKIIGWRELYLFGLSIAIWSSNLCFRSFRRNFSESWRRCYMSTYITNH